MMPRLLRQAVRYVVGWGVAIFFVVLLTLIFSFLGTIICAALAGMMIGAARLGKWKALAISLIFPAVIVSVLRTSGADLSGKQIGLLAVLCFTAFWLIYCLVGAMMNFEHKGQGARVGRPKSLGRKSAIAPAAQPATGSAQPVLGVPGLNLEALVGKWRAEPNGCQVNGRQRLLEISKETLRLSVTGTDGQVSCCWCAQLQVSTQDCLARLSVACQGPPAADPETLISI